MNLMKKLSEYVNSYQFMLTKKVEKDQSNLLGILSIAFGIAGLFIFGFIFGLAGLICGIVGRKKDENITLSLIGIIHSSISIFLYVLVFFGLIAFFSMLMLNT